MFSHSILGTGVILPVDSRASLLLPGVAATTMNEDAEPALEACSYSRDRADAVQPLATVIRRVEHT